MKQWISIVKAGRIIGTTQIPGVPYLRVLLEGQEEVTLPTELFNTIAYEFGDNVGGHYLVERSPGVYVIMTAGQLHANYVEIEIEEEDTT